MSLDHDFCDDRFADVFTAPPGEYRIDAALNIGEAIVTELAAEHAPNGDSGLPVCSMCVDGTPMACEWSREVPKANAVMRVVEDVQAIVKANDDGDWVGWVHTELTDAYADAFYAACADPSECDVCHDAAHGADHGCGHDEHGEPCPARDDA